MGIDPHEDHFREWLRRSLSGCAFAAAAAGRRRGIVYYTVRGSLSVDIVNAFIDTAEARDLFAVVLFPWIRWPAELTSYLGALRLHPRWTITTATGRQLRPDGAVDICIEWTTSGGYRSSVMGFAPIGTMPVTRRAPYYALALWPGGHKNPRFTPRDASKVGFIDAVLDLSDESYASTMLSSKERTAALLGSPPEAAPPLREVAFCLPAEARVTDPLRTD